MALVINTNMSSLIVQKNLGAATTMLNRSIERMTTGYKINHAADNAAGYSITVNWRKQLSSYDVAADNAATGADMLTTLEDNYALITSHVQRVRDLTEQAANGTYGQEALDAIKAEITSRLNEIDRIAANCEFNGKHLMDASITADVNLQVGIFSDANSKIALDKSLFSKADTTTLFGEAAAAFATKCTAAATATTSLTKIDDVMGTINSRVTTLGAAQNRIESATEAIGVSIENITSSLSTLRDADIAKESSAYIKAQILQQASASLLATANQAPSIALNLL